ncbi:MAG: hypothetical protein ACLPX9_05695 [Rhodomicrobium sp.]
MKIALFAPLAAMLFVLSPQLAFAQDAHACKADREKLCPGMQPGDEKMHECMKQHEAELSPECIAGRKERQEAWKKLQASCKADEDKFCAEAGKERGAKMKCLEGHASELAPACADALKSRPGAKKS